MRGRCGANSTYVYYVNSKIRRKNINEAVDLRAKSLKKILQLASYSIIAPWQKNTRQLINFGFTKKLCSDDVNSTTDSPAASSVSTPPAGVTTQEEAEE